MKPEVWSRATEKYKIEEDAGPPRKSIPLPAKKNRNPRHEWKRAGSGSYYLPSCAACKMQHKHKPGCPLTELMPLGRRERTEARS